ncbi:G-protein-signaling modulator 2 [Sparganum proliferum]
MLQKPSEAILCGQRQLEICRRLNDKPSIARALYNLGNAYHSKGRQGVQFAGPQQLGEFTPEAREDQLKAMACYEEYLKVVRELGDKPAEGRAYGNLGNTHHLLGNFKEAVEYHKKRLRIAKEFGDLPAQRRAYSNLGNSYIFLSDFLFAARSYKHALAIALRLGDEALQAQACFSLGNSCTLLHDYSAAVVYYLRHLHIAWRLRDRLGEGRSQWSLANAYVALGDYRRAYRCSLRHRKIAKELGDEVGLIAAELMTNELQRILSSESAVGDDSSVCQSQRQQHQEAAAAHALQQVLLLDDQQHTTTAAASSATVTTCDFLPPTLVASTSRYTTMKAEVDATGVTEEETTPLSQEELESELALARNVALQFRGGTGTAETPVAFADGALIDEDGDLLSLGGELESDFVVVTTGEEDQLQQTADYVENAASTSESKPCQPSSLHLSTEDNGTNGFRAHPSSLGDSAELLFDLLVHSQSQRMNDQRCSLDENQVENSTESIGEDDSFLDLLIGLQGARMNDQRAVLPDYPGLVISPELHAAAVAVVAGRRSSPSGLTSNLHMPGTQQHRRHPSSITMIRPQATANTNSSDGLFSLRIRSSSDGLTELGPPNASTQAANEDLSSDDSFFEMILRLQQRTRLNDQRTDLPVIPQSSPSRDEDHAGTGSSTSPQQCRDGLSRLQRVLSVPGAKKRGRHHV